MQRVAYAARDEKDAEEKNLMAYEYYKRFDNMFTGPGLVNSGLIKPIERNQTLEEMKENLIICPVNLMIDKLSVYAEAGVDDFIVSSSFGQNQEDIIESMHRISENVMPSLKNVKSRVA